ncbi:hypothetical protein H0H81_008219 [Sphagnurus paluster]|uniref:EthD domain-containing protein n=1 Tax=Sphagnurus paluster TaxID=117069 RepID=A0A9P7KLG6_9AGAR|nr:hypothetical protein H0H81_008219 [Sphagnurus paluster]
MPESTSTDTFRVIIFLKRKPGLTREEFRSYWDGPHAQLIASLDIAKRNVKNVTKYDRAHTSGKYVAVPEAIGFSAPDWDGLLLLDGESYEKIFEVFLSEEYQKIVVPDEEKFLDRPKCQMLPVGVVTAIA